MGLSKIRRGLRLDTGWGSHYSHHTRLTDTVIHYVSQSQSSILSLPTYTAVSIEEHDLDRIKLYCDRNRIDRQHWYRERWGINGWSDNPRSQLTGSLFVEVKTGIATHFKRERE